MTLLSNGLANAVAFRWTYADATARAAASGFTSADLYSLALQLDNATAWILTATTPTWVATAGVGMTNPMTTAGDLILGGSGGTPGRLAKGTDGDVLTVDPATHLPAWAAAAGGGAPTTAKYVTTASDGTLSAEVAIPGLAGSADIKASGGAGFAEEWDSGSGLLTWTSSPAAEDIDTTVKSHYHIKTTGTGEKIGYAAWSPAGDFDIRCKVGMGKEVYTDTLVFGMILLDATNANRALIQLNGGSGGLIQCYTYAGTYTAVGSDRAWAVDRPTYLRITRGGTTIRWYASYDGLVWVQLNSTTFSIAVARRGYRIDPPASEAHFISDWMRADV